MRLSLGLQFFIWIIGGLVLVVALPFLASRSICHVSKIEQHHQTTEEDDEWSNALLDLFDEPSRSSFAQSDQPHADTGNDSAGEQKPQTPYPLVCDAKGTDLALVYFTFCLVIVGWFGIRSGERNTEAIERAYLFLGNSPPRFRNRRINFHLAVTNTGRCPGIMKCIRYAFIQRDVLPSTPREADWDWETIKYDWVTPPSVRREKLRRLQGPIGDCFFVAGLTYQDLFTRRYHTSWMTMHIRPDAGDHEQITRGGGDAWNVWD
jgi:hypothetical protein